MEVCCQNLLHSQELQKRAHDKRVKSRSYAPGEKVWLNSKYIKTKRNKKLESKFFGPFRVLHSVGKQAYKLELPTKRRYTKYSTCHYWSRTPPGKGKRITKLCQSQRRSWNSRPEATSSMRLKQSSTVSVRPAGKRSDARPLLPRFVKGLPRRRKHLGTFIGSHTPPEIDQHLP